MSFIAIKKFYNVFKMSDSLNGGEHLPPQDLSPRLCCLKKWPDFSGYGFNLHAERGKAGQFIGKVDDASPASQAGLRQSDKIVEVNGVNVLNQNHHQVVTMIRESGDKVDLLVVDKETEDYYRSHNLLITSTAPNVIISDSSVIVDGEDSNMHLHSLIVWIKTDLYVILFLYLCCKWKNIAKGSV